MTYRLISTVLAKGSFKGTEVALVTGKRCYLSGTQAIMVPSKSRLELPNASPAHFSRKGMREEIFDTAGTGLKIEILDLQKMIASNSTALGMFPYAKRIKMGGKTILEAGSVVVSPSYGINSKSDGKTPYLLHAVMITGIRDWNSNVTALRRSVEACMDTAHHMSLQSLTFPSELPKNMELHIGKKVSTIASTIKNWLMFTQESINTIKSVVIFLPVLESRDLIQEAVSAFRQFFRPEKPAKNNP